jgi:hypothetical protein
LDAPLLPFTLSGRGYRVFAKSGSAPTLSSRHGILSWTYALLQSPPGFEPPTTWPPSRKRELGPPRRHPPVRSLAPSAFPRTRQRFLSNGPACLTGPPAPPGFLNLLTLSSAPCLVALFHATSAHGVAPFRALLLPRSRTPSPTPLPSCRCCVPLPDSTRALGGRNRPTTGQRPISHRPKPVTARSTSRPLRPKPSGACCPASSGRSRRTPKQPAAANQSHLHSRGFRSPARARPRLQGFAPRESPLPNTGGLDRPGHVALLGLCPSRALSLTGMPRPSPQLPSWAFAARSQAIDQLALQGLTSREIGLPLSRLPALLGFAAF